MVYSRLHFLPLLFTTALTAALQPVSAYALPTGGVVSAGSATIVSGPVSTTVNQTSQRAVIDWSTFNETSNQSIRFNDPNSSAITLNRIHDSNPSSINGSLTSNGNVWFINPNGIVFGAQATVNVNGLLATTSNITNSNFVAGTYNFTPGGGVSTAAVSNAGHITVAQAGLAMLVAPNVANSGTITASAGNITLASGDTFTVDFTGDGLINLAASGAMTTQSVANTGTLNAGTGGTVTLTAAQASNVVDSLINLGGVTEATSINVSNQNGDVEISSNINNTTGGNASLTVAAYRDITVDPGVQITSLSTPMAVTLDSNDANAGSGFIDLLVGSVIETGGGNITLGGGPNPLTGYATGNYDPSRGLDQDGNLISYSGIYITNSQILTAGGNISLNGQGSLTINGSHATLTGIRLYDSVIETNGNGNITLSGNGAANGQQNAEMGLGVFLEGNASSLETNAGSITINGTGGYGTYDSYGVFNEGFINALNGSVSISGVGGGSSLNSLGVGTDGTIQANAQPGGGITIDGIGGAAEQTQGVEISGGGIYSEAGYININGTGGNQVGSESLGVDMFGTTIQSRGTGANAGAITIVGQGGNGNGNNGFGIGNDGIFMVSTNVSAVDANISLTGTAGGTGMGNIGIQLGGYNQFTSTGRSNITLTGTGVGGAPGIAALEYFGGDAPNNNFTASTSNISFIANSLSIPPTDITIQTGGNVTFAPTTALDTIGVAGAPGLLSIPSGLLNDITANGIVIGSTSGSGLVSVGTYNWNSNVTFLEGLGSIRLDGITSTAANDDITIATLYGDFINTAGSGALAPGAGGRWLIYSQNAAHDTLDGLVPSFELYNCMYGNNCNIPQGNGLIFSQPQSDPLNESSLMPFEAFDASSPDSGKL